MTIAVQDNLEVGGRALNSLGISKSFQRFGKQALDVGQDWLSKTKKVQRQLFGHGKLWRSFEGIIQPFFQVAISEQV